MSWHDSWRENALRAAGIEVSHFALDVLHHWEQSTPTDGWTNNPLGMPSTRFTAPRALNSPYAAFPTMDAFNKAFKTACHSGHGKPLYTVLGTSDKHSEAWRVIHALKWPANDTETDYPAALLDKLTDHLREQFQSSTPSQRKTVGINKASPDVHAAVQRQGLALHHAANNFSSANLGIAYIVRSVNRHG